MHDLIVRGATVVTRGRVRLADVAVLDGLIAAVGDVDGDGREEIDGSGLHLFPGGIDPHVHFNEPGRTHWEGFDSGTRALAAGGFTTFVDMPLNSVPATVDAAAFDAKLAAAEAARRTSTSGSGAGSSRRASTGSRSSTTAASPASRPSCATAGSTSSRGSTTRACSRGMERIAELGSILLLHAENPEIPAALAEEAIRAGRTSARDFAASRPAVAELEAIERALFFAGETGCAVHIVHVSTVRGVALIEQARQDGSRRDLRDVPALPALHRGRSGADRRRGEVRTAASDGRRPRGALAAARRRQRALRRLRPLAVAPPT